MDFRELENEIKLLISEEKITEAIELVETKLKNQPQSKFHNCIGRDMFHLSEKLNIFLNNFMAFFKHY